MQKPKLTIAQQIEHMKDKGIAFNIMDEAAASEYLSKNNYYFRVKAYAKNYPKYNSGPNKGKYFGLEFAYLVELCILDMLLRNIIFNITQDIEHYIKMQLINDISQMPDEVEDGYSIVLEVFREEELKQIQKGKLYTSACSDLIEKYKYDWAIWNIVEILSFSETVRLYSHFYSKYPELPNISEYLFSVKYLRNATAHNNCLINSLRRSYTSTEHILCNSVFDRLIKTDLVVDKEQKKMVAAQGEYAITSKRLNKWMNNHVINDFIVTIFAYCRVVSSDGVKFNRLKQLQDFLNARACKHAEYFENNDTIKTAYRLIKKYVDYIVQVSI